MSKSTAAINDISTNQASCKLQESRWASRTRSAFIEYYRSFIETGSAGIDWNLTTSNYNGSGNNGSRDLDDDGEQESAGVVQQLFDISSLMLELKNGEKFLIASYYNSQLFLYDVAELVVVYRNFPAFVKVLEDNDVQEIIHNFDNLSDTDIAATDFNYKYSYYTSKLTDEQLARLVKIEVEFDFFDDFTVVSNLDSRYDILTASVSSSRLTNLKFYSPDFKHYLLQHNKMSAAVLYTEVRRLSDEELNYCSRQLLLQLLYESNNYESNSSSVIKTNKRLLKTLGDLSDDDIQLMRQHQLWQLYTFYPHHIYQLAKRFAGESASQHFLRLSEMLAVDIDYIPLPLHKLYFQAIPDGNECPVHLEPFYRGQKYYKCAHDHYVSETVYNKSTNKTCSVCRASIRKVLHINLSSADLDWLFVVD